MKFEEFPGASKDWIDFNTGLHPELDLVSLQDNRQFLHSHRDNVLQKAFHRAEKIPFLPDRACSDRQLENIRRLELPDTVIVASNIEADPLGGPMSQFLKCITTVKVCEELGKSDVCAVPVCWVHDPGGIGEAGKIPFRILDSESELHRMHLSTDTNVPETFGKSPTFSHIPELIAKIEEIGRDIFDPETLRMIYEAYSMDSGPSQSCVCLMSNLMDSLGLLVVDSGSAELRSIWEESETTLMERVQFPGVSDKKSPQDCYMQSHVIPVFASVLDMNELQPFLKARKVLNNRGLAAPFAWPASSATIIDPRSRRILKKYELHVRDLFDGEDEILKRIAERIPCSSISARLDSMKSDVVRSIDELPDLESEDSGFRKAKESGRERILFQLAKMRTRVEAAGEQKHRIARKQIHRVCNSLVPDGFSQEDGLAGIYFILRYSRNLISFLHGKLDITKFEHQLIEMD